MAETFTTPQPLAAREPEALLEHIDELQEQLEVAERDREIQNAVFRIADIATSTEDMNQFYAALHDIVKELTSTDAFFIATYHAEEHCISYPYYEDPHDDSQKLATLPLRNREMIPVEQLSHSWTWKVIHTNEVVRAIREPVDENSPAKKQHGIGASLRRLAGNSSASKWKTDWSRCDTELSDWFRYTDTEIEMMVFMANHIGTALQRRRDSFSLKQAHDSLQASAKELELATKH